MPEDTQVNWRWAVVPIIALLGLNTSAEDSPEIELELLEFLSEWADDDGVILEPWMFDDHANDNSGQNAGDLDVAE